MNEFLWYSACWTCLLTAFAMGVGAANQGLAAKGGELNGKTIAILVADGFEQSELMEPKKALESAGAKTLIVSPERELVKAWKDKQWGDTLPVDLPVGSAKPEQFDALLLPGGVMNPDKLRMNPDAVRFVKGFFDAGKPVAAICHGPWTLIEADVVRGRKLTSWPSLQTDIRNAGGKWTDAEVVVDKDLVTSRKPADIPAFNREMLRVFAVSRK
jgi:protease I